MSHGTARRPRRRLARTSLLLFIVIVALMVTAEAVPAVITRTDRASYAGSFTRPYFENLNAPVTGCTSPCLIVDTQTTQPAASGSFTLAAGASMYLWSPQFGSAGSIPAGYVGLDFFATPSPAIDGTATGTLTTGSTFTIGPVTTANTNDVVVAWIVTRLRRQSVTVTAISDSAGAVTWQGSARTIFENCPGQNNEITGVEWYGIAQAKLTSDTITVSLSTNPTDASGEVFAISGVNTASPFDPAALPQTAPSCSGTSSTPSVSGVSTTYAGDLVFAAMGSFTTVTETAGAIGGSAASIVGTPVGTGSAVLAVEDRVPGTTLTSASCSFGAATTWWEVMCDAVIPASQSVTVSFASTDSGGNVQSTMIAGTMVSLSATSNTAAALTSAAGSVPASGYLRMMITAPGATSLTVRWGTGNPTDFQVSYTSKRS